MKRLLLHACCAPCLSGCLPVLTSGRDWRGVLDREPDYETTVWFYNPNVAPREEYDKRLAEVVRYVEIFNGENSRLDTARSSMKENALRLDTIPLRESLDERSEVERSSSSPRERDVSRCRSVNFLEGGYDYETWDNSARQWADEPERGARCRYCYETRLRTAFETASKMGFDAVATTLTLSPHKDGRAVNETGKRLEAEFGIEYLVSDFKKRGGYQFSIEESRRLGLYRQDYCGCAYSVRTRAASAV